MKHRGNIWKILILPLMLSLLLLPAAAHGEDGIPAGFEPAYLGDRQIGWQRIEGGVSAYLYPMEDGRYRLSYAGRGELGAYDSAFFYQSQLHAVDTVLAGMEGSFWQRLSPERVLKRVACVAAGAALAILGLKMAKRTALASAELTPGPESSRGRTIFRHVRELWLILGVVMLTFAGVNGVRLVVGVIQLL